VTKAYLQKERAFFEKYDAERSDEVQSCIDSLLAMIPNDGSCCLLKMSAGVGFHSITGDWQYDDYDKTKLWTDGRHVGKKKYKSRKIADYNHQLQLMGFVRLRVLSPDEATDKTVSLLHSHHTQQEQMLDVIRLREAKRQQEIADLQARIKAKEEIERKQIAFEHLMEQARQQYSSSQWSEAVTFLTEASKLFPEDTECSQLKERCQQMITAEEHRKSEADAAAQRFSQPLAEVIKGKTSAGNLVGTTVKWLKTEEHTFGQSEHDAFIAEARQLPIKEQKNLKSKLSALAKIVGKDVTDELLSELEL
jgi:hypothetical protein